MAPPGPLSPPGIQRLLALIGLLVAGLACSAAWPQAEAPKRPDLASRMDVLVDPTGDLQVADLVVPPAHHRFAPPPRTPIHLGRSAATHWVRFTLSGTDAPPATFLLVDNRLIGNAALFKASGEGAIEEVAHPDRRAWLSPLTFPLQLGPDETATYYLRLQDSPPVSAEIRLTSAESLGAMLVERQWISGLTVGLLLTFLVYNLIAYFNHLAPASLHFALFLASMIGLQTVVDGILFKLLPVPMDWNIALNVLMLLLVNLTALGFGRVFLLQGSDGNGWRKALWAVQGLVVVMALALPLVDIATWLFPSALLISLLSTLMLIGLALGKAVRGHHHALYYLAARILYVPLIGLAALNVWGLLPEQPLREVGVMLVAAVEAGLLSVGVVRRLQSFEAERVSQAQLLSDHRLEVSVRQAMTAKIAHDLRSPMSDLHGLTQLLQGTRLDRRQRELVEALARSSEKLSYLVERAQNIVSVEANDVRLVVEPLDIQALVENATQRAELLLDGLASSTEVRVSPELPRFVSGDARRLRQTLIELLCNAHEATPQSVLLLTVSTQAASLDSIRFEISGIEKDLSTEYRQIHSGERPAAEDLPASRDARRYSFTIANRLLQRMGGDLMVQSSPKGGSTISFSLRLPCADEQPFSTSISDLLFDRRALLAGLDSPSFEAMAGELRAIGLEVFKAHSSNEAIAVLRSQQSLGRSIELLVIDQGVSDGGGVELAARINTSEALHTDFPIVLLSDYRSAPAFERARNAGIAATLTHPLDTDTLVRTLGQVLAKHSAASGGATPDPGASNAHLRLLLVENDPISQRVLQRLVEQLGAHLDVAASGAAAIERIKQHAYDLVLMDCEMPVLNGFETSRRVRHFELNANRLPTPIIALTGHPPEALQENWRESGVNELVYKPVDLPQLRRLVQEWAY